MNNRDIDIKNGIKNSFVDFYFFLSEKKDRAAALSRIKKHLKDLPELSAAEKKEISDYWMEHLGIQIPFEWHQLHYAKTGIKDPAFIPSPVYEYNIRPHLNHPNFAIVYSNKAYLKRFIPNAEIARSVVANVNGHFLNEDLKMISKSEAQKIINSYDSLVTKPALFSHHGEGVRLLKAPFDLREINAYYRNNYVIQIPVKQHELLSSLGSTVNTLRVVSVLLNGKPHVTCSYIKIGEDGQFANNVGENRFYIGVDEGGKLADYCTDGNYNKFNAIPNGFSFAGLTLPGYGDMIRCAERAHEDLSFFGLVGFDMLIDSEGKPVIIEANLKQPGMDRQVAAGPYFGKYTVEVLEYCKRRNITREVGWPQMW